jgi:hypothetical protein
MARGMGVAGALEGGAGGGGGGEGREGGGGGGAANAVPEVLLEDTLALLAQVSFFVSFFFFRALFSFFECRSGGPAEDTLALLAQISFFAYIYIYI